MTAAVADVSPPSFLQLVAHAQRWRLLQELARSDRRVSELCELLDEPQNLVSYHLAQLRDGGIVTARRSNADGRDTYYRVDLQRCGALFAATSGALHPGIRLEPPGNRPEPPGAPAATGGRSRRAPRVLFLCTGNSARSQIAAALLEHRTSGAVVAKSAGSHPKPLHPLAVRVLADRGVDISDRSPTHVQRFARTRFDHVITLCDKVREVCPELPGSPATAHWSIPDPAADDTADAQLTFVRTADEIDTRVGLLIAQLAHRPPDGRTQHGQR